MKINAIRLLFTMGLLPILEAAQASDGNFQKESAACVGLCEKLFPESTVKDSRLANTMILLDGRLKSNQSALYNFAGKPIVLAFDAAGIEGESAHWESVTSDEKNFIVGELAVALVSTRDFNSSKADNKLAHDVTIDPAVDSASEQQEVEGTDGRSYWVSHSDYDRLHPVGLRLEAARVALTKESSILSARSDRINLDRTYLDNTNQQALDNFNSEVDSYNDANDQHKRETDAYNRQADGFNSELARVGTLAK